MTEKQIFIEGGWRDPEKFVRDVLDAIKFCENKTSRDAATTMLMLATSGIAQTKNLTTATEK